MVKISLNASMLWNYDLQQFQQLEKNNKRMIKNKMLMKWLPFLLMVRDFIQRLKILLPSAMVWIIGEVSDMDTKRAAPRLKDKAWMRVQPFPSVDCRFARYRHWMLIDLGQSFLDTVSSLKFTISPSLSKKQASTFRLIKSHLKRKRFFLRLCCFGRSTHSARSMTYINKALALKVTKKLSPSSPLLFCP